MAGELAGVVRKGAWIKQGQQQVSGCHHRHQDPLMAVVRNTGPHNQGAAPKCEGECGHVLFGCVCV